MASLPVLSRSAGPACSLFSTDFYRLHLIVGQRLRWRWAHCVFAPQLRNSLRCACSDSPRRCANTQRTHLLLCRLI